MSKVVGICFQTVREGFNGHLHEVVDIAEMQYGFMPGRGAVDAVFVLRRLSEKFRAKNNLFFIFVDLKKALDQVPREVILCFEAEGCC